MDGQNTFSGWAVIELFGHSTEVGMVTTEYFGTAAMWRVEVPAVNGNPPRTRFVGPGAVYALNPCTEEAARRLLERTVMPISQAGTRTALVASDSDEAFECDAANDDYDGPEV